MSQFLFPRMTSCLTTKQWYACAKNDFSGCCSVNPCDTGVCPDYETTTTSMTAPTTTATKATSTKSTETSTSKSTSSSSTSNSSTSSSTTSFATSASTTEGTVASSASAINTSISDVASSSVSNTVAAVSATSTASGSSSHSNQGALIGGLAAGFVALAMAFGILSFFIARWRRKRGKQFTLLRWRGPHGQDHDEDERATRREAVPKPYGSEGFISNALPEAPFINDHQPPPSIRSRSNSPAISTRSRLRNPPFNTPGVALQSIDADPASSLRLISSSSTSSPDTFPPKRTFTPELPDTGFYRQRAELATHSQSELINIPLDQRRRMRPTWPPAYQEHPHQHQHRQSQEKPHHKREISITEPPRSTSPPPIITSDGVVLSANFDRFVSGREAAPSEKGGDCANHVMSFMHYDSGSESGMSSYRGDAKAKETGR